jgi:PAB-dependent poly(A)-specific ribonuclease subunit 3
LGQLLVALACGSQMAILDLPRALEHIQKAYPSDFKELVLYLLSKPTPLKSIDQVIVNIAPRFVNELDSAFT